jgi:hypothetical protein
VKSDIGIIIVEYYVSDKIYKEECLTDPQRIQAAKLSFQIGLSDCRFIVFVYVWVRDSEQVFADLDADSTLSLMKAIKNEHFLAMWHWLDLMVKTSEDPKHA